MPNDQFKRKEFIVVNGVVMVRQSFMMLGYDRNGNCKGTTGAVFMRPARLVEIQELARLQEKGKCHG
jgi:hypothetical protein